MTAVSDEGRTVRTDVPARLDRLPWARWHWWVLAGLGTVWILDGLEVTIAGALAERLSDPRSGLGLSATAVGFAASAYVMGAVLGSLVFGYLTDRFGRKKLFLVTLLLYLVATVLTAFSFSPWWFVLMRFVTGAGIGGEYAAINSAIDELVPARVRGTVSLAVNASYWFGAACGAALTVVLLNPALFAADVGWRMAFGLGAVLGLAILLVRRTLPESPRWLFTHGRTDEADELVGDIERHVEADTGSALEPVDKTIQVRARRRTPLREVAGTLLRTYPRRTLLGLALFVGQAFLYNAVYFTQALVLGEFFGISGATAGAYLIPLALGSLIGPLVLGRLFDTVGRRTMITVSYLASGVLLVGTGLLFGAGSFSAGTLTTAWAVVFFFASAGSSAAYLTVSEVFPMEIRALAIALFYSVGTGLGGIVGPLLFGALVDTGDAANVAIGYFIGAGVMILGGIAELLLGVEAANRSLEDVAAPLSATEQGPPSRTTSRAATRSGYAPLPTAASGSVSHPHHDPGLAAEVESIVDALEQNDADAGLTARALRDRLDAVEWGPGRFRAALRHAVATGAVREVGRGRFVAATHSAEADY